MGVTTMPPWRTTLNRRMPVERERWSGRDLLDQLTSNLLLPLTGPALALFCGWVLPNRMLSEELRLGPRAGLLLRVLLRYVAPPATAMVSLAAVVM